VYGVGSGAEIMPVVPVHGYSGVRKGGGEIRQGGQMVKMAVGKEQVRRAKVFFPQKRYNTGSFAAGINNGAGQRARRAGWPGQGVNPAVGSYVSYRKAFDDPFVFFVHNADRRIIPCGRRIC
jgi:hypothetical protein